MRVIRVIGRAIAEELDRLGIGSDVIIAALVAELGLTTAQAHAALEAVRADLSPGSARAAHVDGGAVS